jgi:hypothetical protein
VTFNGALSPAEGRHAAENAGVSIPCLCSSVHEPAVWRAPCFVDDETNQRTPLSTVCVRALTTGLLQSVAGDNKLQRQQRTQLDCLFEHVVDDLNELLSLGVDSNEDEFRLRLAYL